MRLSNMQSVGGAKQDAHRTQNIHQVNQKWFDEVVCRVLGIRILHTNRQPQLKTGGSVLAKDEIAHSVLRLDRLHQ